MKKGDYVQIEINVICIMQSDNEKKTKKNTQNDLTNKNHKIDDLTN